MSVTPLSLVKEFLMVTYDHQDNVIQLLIDGAEAYLAAELNVVFTSAQFTEDLPLSGGPLDTPMRFASPLVVPGELQLLPSNQPVTAVASVQDKWNANNAMTYRLVNGAIEWTAENGIPYGRWPQGSARWHVTYTAGFATVPALIKETVCALVKRRWDARSGENSTGASGAYQSWSDMQDADFMKRVRKAYSRAPKVAF